MYDVIVIGGGPAGMTASLNLLRNKKKVLLIEKESFGGQIATSPRLENFPGFKSISGLDFSDHLFEQISSLGVDFELEEVLSVKKEGETFNVKTNYHDYQSHAIIIANGVKHRKLGLPNEDDLVGKGVSYCAVCDGPFYQDKETFLVGDANTALQYALLLSNYSTKVHVMTLFDKFFGDQILIDRVLENQKIVIEHNVSLLEIKDTNGELSSLVFENTKTKERKEYQSDNVFIAIGQIPHNEPFEDLIHLDNGFIVTNENMETSLPGVYAIGDTRKKAIKQVVTACNDGCIAALSVLNYLNNL